ncbi:unnamed protein product [Peronospora destructor]|uniref:Proline-tRNA ligase class II C-terminal domain-containing protein n=1 Tax=Peronospora destructor TaxID=86335 RepID=A0AAV0TV11_9STRA|nr:unnamed protein product [Peronospora destructor]
MLGQNFGKMFGIAAEYEDGKKLIRDDKGLVLPPRVAPTQVGNGADSVQDRDEIDEIVAKADEIVAKLTDAGIRIPGADEASSWPEGYRKEAGARYMRRDNGAKEDISETELASRIPVFLSGHADMLERATAQRDSQILGEEIVKTKSHEESLTFMGKNEESPVTAETKCFISGKPAKCWVLWGRSY